MKNKFNTRILTIIFIMALGISCVPVEKLSYFNDIDELQEPKANPRTQKLIMPFDRLYIKVISIDPQVTQIFGSTEEIRNTDNGIIGYLVDDRGSINFPFAGNINVLGLTTSEAAAKIQKALSDYVSNTSITVKYVDNRITVIGQVENQGIYSFIQDKLNIYEALSLGGGISRYGDRKKIILIRNEGDKIMHYRLNLSDSQIASKDYYYILPNDVLVVEPLKSASSSYENITYTTILASISTAVAVLLLFGL